jgi:pyridoxine 5'-phosphate synthase PdxJ
MVLEIKPTQVTLVPDGINNITSSSGWDTIKNKIATLRNARGGNSPDLIEFAKKNTNIWCSRNYSAPKA